MKGRALPLLAVLVACAGGPETPLGYGSDPLTTADGQGLHAALFTSPQPPQRGLIEAKLTLTGTDGAPLNGVAVDVTPWMPEHGHGTSVSPTVTDEGDGTWTVSNLYLPMPGQWQLRVAIWGTVNDELVPSFDIH